ncbi:MAG: cell wall-binding repeat-containing protein [Desulfitobacterium sp.]
MRKRRLTLILCIVLSMLILPMNALAASNPTTPTGLKATVISSTQINLSWDPVNTATQYYIYQANSPSGTYTYIGASNATSYVNTALKSNTPYYYRVQALNGSGASAYSTEAWAVTLSGPSGSGSNLPISDERISGADRYKTAVEIAKVGWNTSYYAIIASGENFPDALCAAPLAKRYNAPILLTAKNSLSTETKKQLLALNVKNAVIIGGTGVVTENVANTIKNLGISVSRLAGADRYETSLKVAKEMGNFDQAVIASGLNYQDVLSIAPIAAEAGMPILLTPKDRVSNELKRLLDENTEDTYVLGDTGTISNNVYLQLPSPERLTGANWYELNVNILEAFENQLDLNTIYLATGSAYPDALAGSVLASLSGSPVILVSNPLKQATLDFLEDYSSEIRKVVAFGGTGVISESLLDTVTSKVGKGNDSNLSTTNLSATPLSASQIYLTWNTMNKATAYNVFKSNSYSGHYERIATTSTPYYSDAFLSTGTTYYYKVQAVYSNETGPYSNVVYATTLTVNSALTQPTNVAATIFNVNQINLTWDTVSSAVYYNVYRATSPNGTYTSVASVNTPYYSDTNLTAGLTFYYKIQAVNTSSTSPYSVVVHAQTLLDNNTLAIPANVTATALSPSQIQVKWDSVTNATYYNVYRSTTLQGTYELVASVVTPFHIETSLAPGTMYFYKVQPGNTVGVGNYSNVVYAATQYSISNIGIPSNIKVTPLSASQIFLNWDTVTNATYYNIYRATTSNGTYSIVGTVNTPYFSDNSLTTRQTYYYKVQAGNTTTTGSQSSTVFGTTN